MPEEKEKICLYFKGTFNTNWVMANIEELTNAELRVALSEACALINSLSFDKDKYKNKVKIIKNLVENIK
jgi:hypothetical protein